ncbi:MAG: SurA N-terminal domain-containing protein [Salinisphaera sp.]|nr:SurA N-terminal domain-containing protein [Salinisphaera sp.]
MLQKIRDGASGPLAYVVVAVIAVVFGVWGIGSYFTPSSDPVVASAAGTDITHSQLQNAFNQRYGRIRQMLGKNFDPSLMPPDKIRRNVLNGLINQAVMQAYARDAGYRVTNADLLAQIRSNPQFQENGQFSADRYKALLAQANIQPAQYEAELRHSLLTQQVQQVIGAGAFASSAEVDQAYRLANQQRKTRYLVFNPNTFKGDVKVTSAQIKSYYDSHGKQFRSPQRVKLSYVSLDTGSVSPPAPSEDTLQKLYSQHKNELGTSEQRSADVVRVAISPGDDAAARQSIQAVAAAANHGKTLKQAAGDVKGAAFQTLDSQTQSALPSALGAALFGLDKGALSNPVRGKNAWYLARLTGVTPANTPDFNAPQVQSQLKAMAQSQATAAAYKKQAQQLDDLAYQAPNDLQTISNKLGLKIQHTDWISPQSGPGIGQYDAVRKAAFSDAVYKDKLNSEVIDLGQQRKIVLRVTDRQPAERKPLADVSDDIRQRLVSEKASSRARDAADAALKKIQAGASLESVAKSDPKAALKTLGFIGRSDSSADARIVDVVFSMPLPAKGKDSYQVAPTSDGQVALVAVSDARDSGTTGAKEAKQRKQYTQQQTQLNAQLEYAALDTYLRDQADVNIHKGALQ